MSKKLTQINNQILNFRKQLEAIRNNEFLSLPVANQYEEAVYEAIEDLQEALEEEQTRVMLEKVNQGLGLQK